LPDELCLSVIVAAVLLWYLVRTLCQMRSERTHSPVFVWREASAAGWSDWMDLDDVSPSTDYAAVLTTVRDRAHDGATAVQFASVVQPSDAPAYTLRVLFMSAVREPAHDRTLATTR
jgi:hypothetical protein